MVEAREEHERSQDERILANAKAIEEQTRYLHEIRDQIIPEEEARLKRFARLILLPFVKVLALITFIAGVWDFFIWFLDRYEVKEMASRYVEVAQDLYYEENNPEIAMSFLDKAIELCGGEAEYRFLRSYMEGMGAMGALADLDRPLKKEELDRVHHAYAEAKFLEGLEPKRSESYLLEAQVLMLLKELERAEGLLKKALALEGEDEFVHLRLAQLYLMKGEGERAREELDKAEGVEGGGASKWVYLWRGIVSSEYEHDYVAARRFFGKALELDGKFDLALVGMGWTYILGKERDGVAAREAFLKVLKINPASQKACYGIGLSYVYELNYGVGKMWFDKAIELDDSYLTAYKWRGILNVEMGEYEGAVQDFNAALLLDPMNAELYVERARALGKLGRMEEAMRDLNFSLELEPRAARTLYYMGYAYEMSGEREKALEYLEKALEVDGEFDEVYESKAEILAKMGKKEEAIAAIDKALGCVRANPAYYYRSKGRILKGFEDWGGALKSFEAACEVQPKDGEAWKEVYEMAEKVGEKEKARAALRKYVELCPMDEEAKKALKE